MSKTLLILAAGMGSRFGGLKQIEPMGPNGEFIIDYSIFDAKRAGFDKVVFVIKEENYDVFKETIGKRVEPHIKTEYAFQKNDNLPGEYKELLKDRIKPLGTAHAMLCARDHINEPFAIINADDFYGYDAYEKAFAPGPGRRLAHRPGGRDRGGVSPFLYFAPPVCYNKENMARRPGDEEQNCFLLYRMRQ